MTHRLTAVPRRARPLWARLLGAVAAGTSAVVLLTAGAGWALLTYVGGSIGRIDVFGGLGARPQKTTDKAENFLLVGSDQREGLSTAQLRRLKVGSVESAAGKRSDTMLLVHISERRDGLVVVSIPRDSYVGIPGHGRNKINSAYNSGGPQLAVQTVEQATGIRIDHYVEINFAGFAGMVDAIGGVTVCTPRRLRDPKAHLDLAAGTRKLDGVDALKYVRARSVDGRGDLGRMERQQGFLGSMFRDATAAGVLLDPRKLARFVNAALDSVTTDPGLSRRDMLSLANRLRAVKGDRITFLTVPIADPDYRPGGVGSTVLWDEPAAQRLFEVLRDDRPLTELLAASHARTQLTVPPSQVRVRVSNGAGVPGLARRATTDLGRAGFAVVGPPATAPTTGAAETVVRYDPRYDESVKTIAAALPGARLEQVPGKGRTFEVVVGSAYAGVRPVTVTPPSPSPSSPSSGTPGPSATSPIKTRTAAEATC